MSTKLKEAKENYSDFLNLRAGAMQRCRQAKERIETLERETAEQVQLIESLKAQHDELIKECAINPKAEGKLDANDKKISEANNLLDRKKKMLAAARQASETQIPSIEDGQQFLGKLGDAAASHIVESKRKEIDLAKNILTDAFVCWSCISFSDERAWRAFLQMVFTRPTDEALDKAFDKFRAEVVAPIEDPVQKGDES